MKIIEYFPTTIDDMVINKDHAQNIKKFIDYMDTSIILHGIKSSGKKTIIQTVMNTLFPQKKISECPMVMSSSTDDDKMFYKMNNYYIEINCNSIRSKNKQSILNIIKSFCSSLSFGDDGELRKRIIIIHDIDKVHNQIQYSLRRLMEVYDTCIFIFTTTSLDKILQSLQSRCFCYRLPLLNNMFDVSDLFKQLNIKKQNNMCRGITQSFLKLDNIEFNLVQYKTINDFITKPSMNIQNMRGALYDILSCNIPHNEIIKKILDNLHTKYHEIYLIASEVDIMCLKGSKDIIPLEYFVISCKQLFSEKKAQMR